MERYFKCKKGIFKAPTQTIGFTENGVMKCYNGDGNVIETHHSRSVESAEYFCLCGIWEEVDHPYPEESPVGGPAVGDVVRFSDGTSGTMTAEMLESLYGLIKAGSLYWVPESQCWLLDE